MGMPVFPPVELAAEDGLLALSTSLSPELVISAYRHGVFPWPVAEDYPIPWFAPPKRAVLFLDKFHIPGRLRREMRNSRLSLFVDRNFKEVISLCARSRSCGRQPGTWITEQMIESYTALYNMGYCHSVECYDNDILVGGLYGVSLGRFFAGESMFHLVRSCSKFCFCFLCQFLAKRGNSWIDCQQITPLLRTFGAVEIDRAIFQDMLAQAAAEGGDIFGDLKEREFKVKQVIPCPTRVET